MFLEEKTADIPISGLKTVIPVTMPEQSPGVTPVSEESQVIQWIWIVAVILAIVLIAGWFIFRIDR